MDDSLDFLENITYDELAVGDTATLTRTLTEDELMLFAIVSGDVNPVNLDAEFAAESIFRERVAHGMWSGSLISAALATVMPGPGTIHLGQSLHFCKPVRLEDTLTVTLTIASKEARNRVTVKCEIINQNNQQVLIGEANVIAPRKKMSLPKPQLPKITLTYE